MGNRITRAAMHLSADAVQERIRGEKRPRRRQRWEIIYQALTAPRQAEDIAKTVGVSLSTIQRVIATYKQEGVAAIETPGKGGRRHHYLTLEQEQALLQPFLTRAAPGEMATAAEIKLAYEQETKQSAAPSTVYRLLARNGWRQFDASARPSPASESRPTQPDTPRVREGRQQQTSPGSANKELVPQRPQ